jgi:hypothetical protein
MTPLTICMSEEVPQRVLIRCNALFESQSFLVWSKDGPGRFPPGQSTRWETFFLLSRWIEDSQLPALKVKGEGMKRLSYILNEQSDEEFAGMLKQIQGGQKSRQERVIDDFVNALFRKSLLSQKEDAILGRPIGEK